MVTFIALVPLMGTTHIHLGGERVPESKQSEVSLAINHRPHASHPGAPCVSPIPVTTTENSPVTRNRSWHRFLSLALSSYFRSSQQP